MSTSSSSGGGESLITDVTVRFSVDVALCSTMITDVGGSADGARRAARAAHAFGAVRAPRVAPGSCRAARGWNWLRVASIGAGAPRLDRVRYTRWLERRRSGSSRRGAAGRSSTLATQRAVDLLEALARLCSGVATAAAQACTSSACGPCAATSDRAAARPRSGASAPAVEPSIVGGRCDAPSPVDARREPFTHTNAVAVRRARAARTSSNDLRGAAAGRC